MKFICLGYIEETKWDEMSDIERTAFMEECFDVETSGSPQRSLRESPV